MILNNYILMNEDIQSDPKSKLYKIHFFSLVLILMQYKYTAVLNENWGYTAGVGSRGQQAA